MNSLNELTTATNHGTLTVAGTTTVPVTSVTVNSLIASNYADATFALGGFTVTNGVNFYRAIGEDSSGDFSTNSVTVNLPATNNYTYDSNGNLLGDGTRSFTYDDENELISACVSNAWSNSFAYDGKMRRRIERDYTWQSSVWVETNEVHFIYDGKVVIEERSANNNPLVSYTRGNDLSGAQQGAGGIGGMLARTDYGQEIPGAPTTAFYHADGNGNITALMYPSQQMAAKYLYDPFGNMLAMSGPLMNFNKYRFSSKEWNDNAGLYYYDYRFYDPNLQRWLNRDPLGEGGFIVVTKHRAFKKAHIYLRFSESSQGPDPYQFISNDSENKFDPKGLKYDDEECKGLLNAIDFMYSLLGRNGIDSKSVIEQIHEMEDEYDENCGDDDDKDPEPAPAPRPPCPSIKPPPVPTFCVSHPAICGLGIGTGLSIIVCIVQPELCIPVVIIAK